MSALNCCQSAKSLFDTEQFTSEFLDLYSGVQLVAESTYHT